MIARYPGFKGGGTGSDTSALHLDNGNNSLLPPTTSDRRHSQLNFWFCLEDVAEDQAPTLFIPDADGQHHDASRAEAMVAPGGSVAIFHNYSWHAASDYHRADGQRYVARAVEFLSPEEAASAFAAEKRRVVVLSYGWLTPDHPDPYAKNTASVKRLLDSAVGRHFQGLFWDFASRGVIIRDVVSIEL